MLPPLSVDAASTPETQVTHIRLFATTDGTDASRMALEYCKALLHVLPVRVIPAAAPGVGIGIWPGYEMLLRPIDGGFINCVACAPDQWCRVLRMEVPAKLDPFVGEALRSSWEIQSPVVIRLPPKAPEVLVDTVELWTANVRNILFPSSVPKNVQQLDSAKKYDAVVVSNLVSQGAWGKHGVVAHLMNLPVADLIHQNRLHDIVRGVTSTAPAEPATAATP